MQHVSTAIARATAQRNNAGSPPGARQEIPISGSCPICGGLGLVLTSATEARRCSCMRQRALERRFRYASLERHLRGATFDNFSLAYYGNEPLEGPRESSHRQLAEVTLAAVKGFCREVVAGKQASGLMIVGPVGSGKTHLAAAAATTLIEGGRQVLFVVVPDFLDELRFSYRMDRPAGEPGELELLQGARQAGVLILDDLGAHSYSEWARSKLFSLLNYRLNSALPVMVTSNLDFAEMEEYLGQRITSRLVEMCRTYRLLVDRDIRCRRGLEALRGDSLS